MPPTVNSWSPRQGNAGTVVTFTGLGLDTVTAVDFADTRAASVNAQFGQAITTAPARPLGAVQVYLRATDGDVNAGFFTYAPPPPTVTGMSPTSGDQGTVVTISGADLTGATAVSFGAANGTGLTVAPAGNSLTVTAPAGAGAVTVTVRHPSGDVGAGTFTYPPPPPPTVTGMSPSTGDQGTVVTITGSNLGAVTSVGFGATNGTLGTIGATQLTVTAPPGTGSVAVVVRNATGNAAAGTFVYLPLAVSSWGPQGGTTGTVVTFTGTGMAGVTQVRFGTTPGTSLSVSSTQVRVAVPAGLALGPVQVTLYHPAGNLSPGAFTMLPYDVTSWAPVRGSEGTLVTIAGRGLAGTTAVTFGGVPGTGLVVTDTLVVVVAPPAPATPGPVPVVIVHPGGPRTIGTFDYGCPRRAWLVLPPTGETMDLEDPGGGWACPELDIGWPAIREVINNRPDVHGTDDVTTLFGARPVSAHVIATGQGGVAIDDVPRRFAPFVVPSQRPELHWTLDTPDTAYAERMITLRPSDFSSPISGRRRDMHLSWTAPDPAIYDPAERLVTLSPSQLTLATPGGDEELPVLPVVSIYGPVTGPYLDFTFTPPGQAQLFQRFALKAAYVLAAGRSLTIDFAAHAVTLDDGTSALAQIDWLNSIGASQTAGWPYMFAGVANQLILRGSATTGATRAEIRWHDAYLWA